VIYLIFKIFIYLLLSLGIGFAAGWLTRNIASTKREEALQKTVTEARARVPQFESLMRTRDEQVQRLRDEMSGKDARIAELSGELHGKEEQIRSTQREINTLSSRNQALEPGGDDEETAILMGGEIVDLGGAGGSVDPAEIAALKADVERLNGG
jgi:TolA-binding protein